MKETKKQRKRRLGMNSITHSNFKRGFSAPLYCGPDGYNEGGKILPAFSKIRIGTPYVNPSNFI